jgi:hypothetical protein
MKQTFAASFPIYTGCGRKNTSIWAQCSYRWVWGRVVGSVSLDRCLHAGLNSHHRLVGWAPRFCCQGVRWKCRFDATFQAQSTIKITCTGLTITYFF